jgi:mono/diheme cytochrome c family protein
MRKRYLWLIAVAVLLLVAALVLVSCGSNSTTTTAAPAGPTTTSGGSATTAAGAVDAAALYTQYCAGCHKSTPSGSADDVKTAIQNGKGDMPSLSDKLSAAQIAALATWVANGGK